MPTITTTVTSAEASGATTTVTTTMATPAPPAAAAKAVTPLLPGHRGGIISRQAYNFASTQDRDDFIAALEPITKLMNAGKPNQMQVYIFNVSPTEFQTLWQWATPDAFFGTEQMFGKLEIVTRLMGTYTATGHFGGNVGPIQSRLDEWNEAPGFNVIVDDGSGMYFTDNMPADRTASCAVGDMEFPTGAEMDTFLETWATCNGIFNQTHATFACIRTSPTHATMLLVQRNKAASLQHLVDVQQPEMAPLISQIANMTTFGGFVFGNNEDAEIKAGIAGWPTFKPVPLVGGNFGGEEILFVAVHSYDTKAERDECMANLATATWVKGESTYFTVPKGETSYYVVHRCANYAACKALQGSYASGEKIFPDLEKCTNIDAYLGCNLVKEWQDDFDGWIEHIGDGGVMQRNDSQIAFQTSGSKVTANAIHFVSRTVYNSAEDLAMLSDVYGAPEMLNAWATIPQTACAWKTGSKSAITYHGYESCEDWLRNNEITKTFGAEIASKIKSMEVHCVGTFSAEAKAALNAWAAAPWCTVVFQDKVSGKSVYN